MSADDLALDPAADTSWMAAASCRGMDPAVFFPVESKGPTVDAARAVCAGCQVRVDCLLHAINQGEEWGVWGGMHENDRRQVRRGRPRLPRVS